MIVVKTAGPITSGMPKGTTPIVEVIALFPFSAKSKSLMANTSNKSPPAILKSYISMPNMEKTDLPMAKKPILIERAVITDWFIIFVGNYILGITRYYD